MLPILAIALLILPVRDVFKFYYYFVLSNTRAVCRTCQGERLRGSALTSPLRRGRCGAEVPRSCYLLEHQPE